ncbi:hypothetical protein DCAR_0520194 [Daucus carota subsp. sativus]|uniref:PRA1 family protein n=1 Tax=Daucus carota subsp. sativus TaxID=79200 RepID=A0A164YDX1_DAUCS|nr:PREDICTED: PRA1 family protein G2 [Daucus carota subsp. sativus]WOH00819.1 hypothetical protein DCAR_0520194 [Daucus carota subsp. sativus]
MLPPQRASSDSTYTTIPVSFSAAISRSFQNLSTTYSRQRPWPEFLASASECSRPDSLAGATSRLRLNSKYFGINYAIVITLCGAFSLLGSPLYLLLIASVFFLWLLLWFSREDQIVIGGHHISEQAVMIGLAVVSVAVLWFTGVFNTLLIGVSVGILIVAVHCMLRIPEGVFLDENDAVHSGLINAQSTPSVNRV